MGIPNALRVVLAIVSAATFIPQYRRIAQRKSCDGLSPWYILLNTIIATHQFSMGLAFVLFDKYYGAVHSPPTAGDWLNLVQFATVFVGHIILFLALLVYPPSHGVKTIVTIFVTFLVVSLGPIVFIAVISPNDQKWPIAFFQYAALIIENPIVTLLTVVAGCVEVRHLQLRSTVGSVSTGTLALQALVFVAVGITWNFRMAPLPRSDLAIMWYRLVGFAVLDNILFAVAQLGVWWVARRMDSGSGIAVMAGESSPLLGHA